MSCTVSPEIFWNIRKRIRTEEGSWMLQGIRDRKATCLLLRECHEKIPMTFPEGKMR